MTIYYVDATDGLDGNNGTSELTPWKTCAKVNGEAKSPGDLYLFERDELWRELLEPDTTATFGSRITYGAYGSGNLPIIKGSDLVSTWAPEGQANTWEATLTTEPTQVFFDGTKGTKEAAKVNLNAAREWFWEANVLYVYSTSDPDTAYIDPGIEASIRTNCVRPAVMVLEYNIIEYLNAQHSSATAGSGGGGFIFRWGNQNNIVRNCEASWHWGVGMGCIENLDTQAPNNTYEDCVSHDSNHPFWTNQNDTTFDGCTGYNATINYDVFASGFKFLGDTLIGGIIQYCIAYSNNKNGIHVDGDIAEADAARIGQIKVRYNRCYDNGNGGIRLEKIDDSTEAYYNICWDNVNGGIIILHGADSVNIYNNVCFSNTVHQIGVDPERSEVHTHTNINIKNNIMDGDGAVPSFIMGPNVTEASLDLDYNCHWNAAGVMINWNGVTYTQAQFANFQAAEGQEANGISQDPLFVDTANDNFTLQSTSPCINASVDVGLDQDFDGAHVPQGVAPDIGAYEYETADELVFNQSFRSLKILGRHKIQSL